MKICKYAGDPEDQYCKSCDGIKMEVNEEMVSCKECVGYVAGDVDAIAPDSDSKEAEESHVDEAMNPPFDESTNNKQDLSEKQPKDEEAHNTTPEHVSSEMEEKNKSTTNKTEVTKVKEEKQAVEKSTEVDGSIRVMSMRYTSGATIKRGDNYFKFIAEEEWDTSQITNVDDVREQLWAKLNGEVDKQIEELQNMQ